MKRIVSLIIFYFFSTLFSITIYFNTFDNSLIINQKVYKFSGEALPFKGKIITYFKSPSIEIGNVDIPNDLLVLEDGQTIGQNGTIIVSKDVFDKIVELYTNNDIEKVIIDRFPVEIYDDKIIVKELISRDKLISYLKIFKNNFEITNLDYYLGTYDITPDYPKIEITTFSFPNIGYYNVKIIDKSAVYTKVYVNGKDSKKSGTLTSGTYKIFVKCMDELGYESSKTTFLDIPKSKINFQKIEVEFGKETEFGKINYIGTRNFYEITPLTSTITTITSKDTTSPTINVSIKKLFNDYYSIKVLSNDLNKTKNVILLNNNPINNGVVKLEKGKNLLIVMSKDTFDNYNLKHVSIYNYQTLDSTLTFLDEKRWINIGGVLIKSPYIISWVNPNIERRIYEDKRYIINIEK
ncbi:MAG: hypothetical protein PWQ45_476 [Thermosipho sp. (in: thermotogales)]|nr:hypothetical protein [Thermosipho sp. (in: thermotogales)]